MTADGIDRGYVDDASGTLAQHQPRTGLRQHQGCSEVDLDGFDDLARAHGRENAFDRDARIVDEHIDPAQPLPHIFHERAQRLVIASVHCAPMEMPALAGTQHVGDEGRLGPAQGRYPIPPVEKSRHEFGSQAATTPTNQGDLSGLWHGRPVLTLTNLLSGVGAGTMLNGCLVARFLEARTVVILYDHVDDGGNFVALKSRTAELADAQLEGVRILGRERCDPGGNDLAGNRIWMSAHRDVFDVVELEQHILDLGRVHLLAADVDQLRLAAEDVNVLAVSFDEILRVEPAVRIERRRCVQIAEHRARRSDPEYVVDDLVLKTGIAELDPHRARVA